jgi:hypothetical protein
MVEAARTAETASRPPIDPDRIRYKVGEYLGINPLDPLDYPKSRRGLKPEIENVREDSGGFPYQVTIYSVRANGLKLAEFTKYSPDLRSAWNLPVLENFLVAAYEMHGVVDNEIIILRTMLYDNGQRELTIKSRGTIMNPTDEDVKKIEKAFGLGG